MVCFRLVVAGTILVYRSGRDRQCRRVTRLMPVAAPPLTLAALAYGAASSIAASTTLTAASMEGVWLAGSSGEPSGRVSGKRRM